MALFDKGLKVEEGFFESGLEFVKAGITGISPSLVVHHPVSLDLDQELLVLAEEPCPW